MHSNRHLFAKTGLFPDITVKVQLAVFWQFRRRIRGSYHRCASSWPPRDPWYRQKWSRQRNRIDGMGEGWWSIYQSRDIYTRCRTSGANIRTFHPLVGVQSICSPLVEPIPRLLTIQTCSRTWNRNQGCRNSETGYVRILSLWTFRIMRISRDIQRSENITWLMPTSNLGEMTPHLFKRPFNSTTILPALWSSMISNSPMYPCFIITWRNLMMT